MTVSSTVTSARGKKAATVGAVAAAPSRQAARTAATRRKLLLAAEQTFARDGYEAARLEDIAARAGYTRGAFYANFASKEETWNFTVRSATLSFAATSLFVKP